MTIVTHTHQLRFRAAFALWAALCLVAAYYGTRLGYGGRRFGVALAVFALLLAAQIFLAARKAGEWLLGRLGARGVLAAPLAPLLIYLIYCGGVNSFRGKWIAFAAAYALAPALLVFRARSRPPGRWEDYAAVLAIWLPVELRWMYKLWPYPPQLTHTLTILFALTVGLAAFLLVRQLDGIGYSFEWGRGFGWAVGLHFVVFAAIAIPLGEAMGFLKYAPSVARDLPVVALGIMLFTAWPEEFLFRGLLQNLLSRTLKGQLRGWIAASVIFGLSHINNGPFPNWRYVLLATIAGLFYGRVWRKTGSIFTSALVHALVDISWHALFR